MHAITITELIWQREINERQACCRWEKIAFPQVDCIVKGHTWTHRFLHSTIHLCYKPTVTEKLLFFSVAVKLCYCFGFCHILHFIVQKSCYLSQHKACPLYQNVTPSVCDKQQHPLSHVFCICFGDFGQPVQKPH